MNLKPKSAVLTLWTNRVIMVLIAMLCFLLPKLLDWYAGLRSLSDLQQSVITAAFYACVVVILIALVSMDYLLRNIVSARVFSMENVCLIRRVCLCCAAVSLICLPAGFFYPPLFFLTIIMVFLSMVVNVVQQVMKAAVLLREETELTI